MINLDSPPICWSTEYLNIAAWYIVEEVLGPGRRLCIWTQGCLKNCPGCLATQWKTIEVNELITPDAMAALVLSEPFTGISISGGEPFLQSYSISRLLEMVLFKRKVDVICYSGYTLAELKEAGNASMDLLEKIDVLIDGEYKTELNNDIGLRGSTNQVVHHLTNALIQYDFEYKKRQIEIVTNNSETLLIGVPTKNVLQGVENFFSNVREHKKAV